MSEYTTISNDIYFLNDKNIVSSFSDNTDRKINPIPSFDLAKSGYNELSVFKNTTYVSVDAICQNIVSLSNALSTNDAYLSNLLSINIGNIAELSNNDTYLSNILSTSVAYLSNALSTNDTYLSNLLSINTAYINLLVGLDAPYSKGLIKELSDDIASLSNDLYSSIKFHNTVYVAGDLLTCTSLVDLFTLTGVIYPPGGYAMNGTMINIVIEPSNTKMTLLLNDLQLTIGDGDVIVLFDEKRHQARIYIELFYITEIGHEGNIHLIKAGVSKYDLYAETSARTDVDNYLSNELSSNDTYLSNILSTSVAYLSNALSTNDAYLSNILSTSVAYLSNELSSNDVYLSNLLSTNDAYLSNVISTSVAYLSNELSSNNYNSCKELSNALYMFNELSIPQDLEWSSMSSLSFKSVMSAIVVVNKTFIELYRNLSVDIES